MYTNRIFPHTSSLLLGRAFFLCLLLLATSSASAQWMASDDTDPMTDALIESAEATAEGGAVSFLCTDAHPGVSMVLMSETYVSNRGMGNITYRIGDAPAVTVSAYHVSTGTSLVLVGNTAWTLAQAMYVHSGHTYFQWADYRGTRYLIELSDANLTDALDALSCFDPTTPPPVESQGITIHDSGVVPGSAADPKP